MEDKTYTPGAHLIRGLVKLAKEKKPALLDEEGWSKVDALVEHISKKGERPKPPYPPGTLYGLIDRANLRRDDR